MTEPYGMHVRFTAQPGRGDELERLLLEAADGVRLLDECRLYLVSRSPDEPDAVWVTEAWTSREAHDASLTDPAARALIVQAMPLLSGAPLATTLRPVGGKGL
jgi:quinol monooxygenase YgiN